MIERVRSFVGDIPEIALELVDSFIGDRMALFVPAVGQCPYAITKEHTHPAYSFLLTFDENLIVGNESQNIRSIEKGTLIAMSPDFKHHEEPADEFSRYYAFFFECDFYNSVLELYGVEPNPHYPFTCSKPASVILPLLREFMEESKTDSAIARDKITAIEKLLLHKVVESFHPVTNEESSVTVHDRIEVDRAVEYIYSNFAKKLTVDMIASKVCLSPSHLSSLFKEGVGKSVMGFVTDVRLQDARKQLLLKKYTISEIAMNCGFSSPSHFAQSFKNRYGMSPREVLKST